jgi:ADP-heptose:LPS heptosyltransferase
MKTITTIVAVINENLKQVRNCLTAIDTERFEVMVVCPTKYHTSVKEALEKMTGISIKACEQTSIRGLWRQGEKSAITPWIMFIQSSDILTIQLQNNIEQRCRTFTPCQNYRYNLQRISTFLKRRTKYCHFWTGEPTPYIRFNHSTHAEESDNFKGQELEETWPTQMGSLLHYGPETLSKAITSTNLFIEEWAENIYHKSPNLDKKTILKKAAKESLRNFFRGLLFKKWLRDGYEGFIFASLDLFITCFGYLRYHEKYIRSGRQLSNQLNSIQNILLVQVNGIGDVVDSTPTLRNVKNRLPKAKVDVLVTKSAKGVMENNPYINRIFTLSRLPQRAEIKQTAKNLKSFEYDLILNLISRNSTEKLVGLLSGKWKINLNFFNQERFTDVMLGFKNDGSSLIQCEFEFLKKIGFEPKKYYPQIFLKSEEIEDARHFLNSAGFSAKEKLVVFHPFASDPLREWGMKQFIDLAKRLDEVYKCNILFVGSKNELDTIRATVSSQIPRGVLYDGSVRKTMGIINESNLLIGGDSAFSHISFALNTPTIVNLGPLWKPFIGVHWDDELVDNRKNFFILRKELSCRDLLNSGCGSCSEKICFEFSVDAVLAKALEILN